MMQVTDRERERKAAGREREKRDERGAVNKKEPHARSPEFSFRLRGTKKFLEYELEKDTRETRLGRGVRSKGREERDPGIEVTAYDTSIMLEDSVVD